MKTNETILFLEGGPSIDYYDQYDELIEAGYNVSKICNLFSNPTQLSLLPKLNPDCLFIGTTGMFMDDINNVVETFEKINWIPNKVIFANERSAMVFLGLAKKLKRLGVKFYYWWDSEDVEEIEWI